MVEPYLDCNGETFSCFASDGFKCFSLSISMDLFCADRLINSKLLNILYSYMNFGHNVWTVWILKLGTNQSMLTHNGTHVSHMLGRIFFLTSGCWRHVVSSRSQSPKNPCCQWASVSMLLNPLGWGDSYLLCLRLRSSQIMFSGNQWLALGSPIKGNPRGDHFNPWRYGVHHQHRICQLLAGAVGA